MSERNDDVLALFSRYYTAMKKYYVPRNENNIFCIHFIADTVVMWQRLRSARTLRADWMGTKGDESSTGSDWAGGFQDVTAYSCFARGLKVMNRLFGEFPFFSTCSNPWITET